MRKDIHKPNGDVEGIGASKTVFKPMLEVADYSRFHPVVDDAFTETIKRMFKATKLTWKK